MLEELGNKISWPPVLAFYHTTFFLSTQKMDMPFQRHMGVRLRQDTLLQTSLCDLDHVGPLVATNQKDDVSSP